MKTLLIQGCSKSKLETDEAIPAWDMYTGYYFKIIKKAMTDQTFDSDIDIYILSARHGLLSPDEKIERYDMKMDPEQAETFNSEILDSIKEIISDQQYRRIVLNLGKSYEPAVSGIDEQVDAQIVRLKGDLGVRGKKLKNLIRTDSIYQATA